MFYTKLIIIQDLFYTFAFTEKEDRFYTVQPRFRIHYKLKKWPTVHTYLYCLPKDLKSTNYKMNIWHIYLHRNL